MNALIFGLGAISAVIAVLMVTMVVMMLKLDKQLSKLKVDNDCLARTLEDLSRNVYDEIEIKHKEALSSIKDLKLDLVADMQEIRRDLCVDIQAIFTEIEEKHRVAKELIENVERGYVAADVDIYRTIDKNKSEAQTGANGYTDMRIDKLTSKLLKEV